ncbi:MAG: ribonuclease HI [Clostridiaceae bacterium]|nr:ribonuclease HI [Eubacteriales bacterium]
MKIITIYTDGACSGNPGPGGWGAILQYNEAEKELSGAQKHTTNNRMELMAAIEALKALKEPCEVKLYTDSAYLARAFNERWLYGWQANGWKTSNKKDVENRDLWQELIVLTKTHRVEWIKVKGHSDNAGNNRCDALARGAIAKLREEEAESGQPQD